MDNSNLFTPPWYLRSGHLQTLLTGFFKPKAKLPTPIEHRLSIAPFGELLVYENKPCGSMNSDNIGSCDDSVSGRPSDSNEAVFLLHGLGSSHRGTYMTHLADELLSRGKRVFRFDLPGAGDSYRYTLLPPHGACAPLLVRGLNELTEKLKIEQWMGVGVSLGGNLLLKILSGMASGAVDGVKPAFSIAKAVSVAPPIDLAACCEHMERGIHRIYAKYFLRSLRAQTKIRAALWPQWDERLKSADFSTIRRFDETITAPLAGFRNASDYYRNGSTKDELDRIETPLTVLVDRQDPIVPYRLFQDANWSSSTTLIATQRGGHVGYIYRANFKTPTRFSRWADRWIVERLLTTAL